MPRPAPSAPEQLFDNPQNSTRPGTGPVGGGCWSSPGGAVSVVREKNSLKYGRETSMMTAPSTIPQMPNHSGSVRPRSA